MMLLDYLFFEIAKTNKKRVEQMEVQYVMFFIILITNIIISILI
jgi:hypothetical protein